MPQPPNSILRSLLQQSLSDFVLRLCPNPHQQVEPQLKFPSPFREQEPILLAAEALAGGGGSELGCSQSRATLLVIRAEWAVV